MRMGSPMSRTKISEPWLRVEACTTSDTASEIVMKKRRASGCVTLMGPPAAICSWNIGTTLPLLPSTLPKRTETQRVCALPGQRAETMRSQTRLVAPITQIGFTALSEEIISRLRTLWPRAARTRFHVPKTLLLTASRTCDSIMGTCL